MPAAPALSPHVRGHWLTGVLKERREDPLGLFTRLTQRGSEVSSFKILWFTAFSLNSPEAVKHVLVDNAQNYWKGRPIRMIKLLLGEGLLTAEGELWLKNRRLAQPAFHRERLAGLMSSMVASTATLLERWEQRVRSDQPFDVFPEMMGLTMSIVGRTLFSTDVSEETGEVGNALSYVLEETNRRLLAFNPLTPKLPSARNRRFKHEAAILDRIIYRIIAERRRGSVQANDLLSMLMEAKDTDTGEGMDDRQLRDEAMTLFLAGHETTAVAISWLWVLLDKNPAVLEKLQAEVAQVLQGRAPTVTDLPQLKYTTRVIEEGMRLYPPAWAVIRQTYREDVVCGHRIPADKVVVTSPYALHRLPQYWPDPEVFDPDRFTPERSAGRPKLAYLPFGAGQRMCIGNNFAMMEAQVILAMVVQRFRLNVVPGQSLEPLPQITLRLKHGLKVHLTRARSRTGVERPTG